MVREYDMMSLSFLLMLLHKKSQIRPISFHIYPHHDLLSNKALHHHTRMSF